MINSFVHVSVMYNWFYFYWLNAKSENCWEKYANLFDQYFSKFHHLLVYFHNIMEQFHIFKTFKLLKWHLMPLVSWKNAFFLATTFEYVYPLISQRTNTWKNITDKYFFRKWLNIISRINPNPNPTAYLSFEKIKKMKEFNQSINQTINQ